MTINDPNNRDRAARGWSLAYQGSCIDPMDQSHPLDPSLKAAGARRFVTIRLLKKDPKCTQYGKFLIQVKKAVDPWAAIQQK